MKKWPILLVVLCLALFGQDREAKYHLVPYSSIRDDVAIRIVHGRPETRGLSDIARDPLIQTNVLTITADEMEWNHDTNEIELRGNVRVKLLK
jgi:hypothetical protein